MSRAVLNGRDVTLPDAPSLADALRAVGVHLPTLGLPQELQYRFVGRDLVLVDTHADLVLDILRNAVR